MMEAELNLLTSSFCQSCPAKRAFTPNSIGSGGGSYAQENARNTNHMHNKHEHHQGFLELLKR